MGSQQGAPDFTAAAAEVKLRAFIERHAPRQFRDEDGVAHDSAFHVDMLAALDALVASLTAARQERDERLTLDESRTLAFKFSDAEEALDAARQREQQLTQALTKIAAADGYTERASWLIGIARAVLAGEACAPDGTHKEDDWRCECGDLNRWHEWCCFRCGAAKPDAADAGATR